ncbi:hypothetical protein KY289_016514 [Solanum tuberosum]|nr:hypothetical protein KY289_016514 [Solanum tuberosum]
MDFNDREAPYPCLEIVENKQHSRAKVLTLKVHPPVIVVGRFLSSPGVVVNRNEGRHGQFSGKVTTEKVLLLKSSTHQNVVVAIPPRRDEKLSSWCVPPLGFGVVRYTSGYWEWVEDVLARCKETLDSIKTSDAILT